MMIPGGSHPHLHSAVPILCQLPGQELVQLSLENAVVDELALFGNLRCHVSLKV